MVVPHPLNSQLVLFDLLNSHVLLFLSVCLQVAPDLVALGQPPLEVLDLGLEVLHESGLVAEPVASGLESLDLNILVLRLDSLVVQLLHDLRLLRGRPGGCCAWPLRLALVRFVRGVHSCFRYLVLFLELNYTSVLGKKI